MTDAYGQEATGTVVPAAVTIAPTAPSITQVAVGDGKVTLTIGAPASDGGQPVTSYTVVVGPTGQRITVPSSGTVTIDGLTNGAGYTFTVVATNAVGTSAASAPAAATPVASGAPGLKNARFGNHKLWVTVVPPASTGTPIVGYTVTLAPGRRDPAPHRCRRRSRCCSPAWSTAGSTPPRSSRSTRPSPARSVRRWPPPR